MSDPTDGVTPPRATHTPDPWTADGREIWAISPEYGRYRLAVVDAPEPWRGVDGLADALLLAAGLELLAALRLCRSVWAT